MRKNVLGVVFICLFSGLAQVQVQAQQGTLPQDQQALQQYLASELVVAAGIGFEQVRLGQPFAALQSQWGEPAAVREGGLFGVDRYFIYRPRADLQIELGGDDRIEEIIILGNFASPFRTARLIRFGEQLNAVNSLMQPFQGSVDDNVLSFEQAGISFNFANGRVNGIRVYPAN